MKKNVTATPDPKPFNPLEKRKLAESIARELLSCPCVEFPPPHSFAGAGIYVLYYRGDFPLYSELSAGNEMDWTRPIYVGRASPPGKRKGLALEETTSSPALYRRLAEHAKSIEHAANLKLSHFRCRFLVVDDFWISLAEALLIEQFQPLWNQVVDGFGLHDVGKRRHGGKASNWDVLHPGRSWATKLTVAAGTREALEKKIRAHFKAGK